MIRINMLAFRVPSFLWRGAVLWGWGLFRSAAIPFFCRGAIGIPVFLLSGCLVFLLSGVPAASCLGCLAFRCPVSPGGLVSCQFRSSPRCLVCLISRRFDPERGGSDDDTPPEQHHPKTRQPKANEARKARRGPARLASPRCLTDPICGTVSHPPSMTSRNNLTSLASICFFSFINNTR